MYDLRSSPMILAPSARFLTEFPFSLMCLPGRSKGPGDREIKAFVSNLTLGAPAATPSKPKAAPTLWWWRPTGRGGRQAEPWEGSDREGERGDYGRFWEAEEAARPGGPRI